jgi:hypothetical protein
LIVEVSQEEVDIGLAEPKDSVLATLPMHLEFAGGGVQVQAPQV